MTRRPASDARVARARARAWLGCALAGATLGCAMDPLAQDFVQVELTVISEAGVQLDQIQLVFGQRRTRVPERPEPLHRNETVTVLLDAEQAGRSLELAVWGLDGGRPVAFGSVELTPERERVVEDEVTLAALRCEGAACGPDLPARPAAPGCGEADDGDPCDGERPSPAECFAETGTCRDGACVYAAADGASCDDGDPCTSDDACADGDCTGTAVRCDSPPDATCMGDVLVEYPAEGTCDGGECVYGPIETECPGHCVEAACACTPGTWMPVTVDEDAVGSATRAAIAADVDGGVHVLYGAEPGNELRYAHKPATGAWQVPLWVATGSFAMSDVALAVDAEGSVHAAFDAPGASGRDLWEGVLSDGAFGTRALVMDAYSPALTADAAGGVHLSYYDATLGNLVYARKAPGQDWIDRIADAPDAVGDHSAIAVDASGGVHLVYQDLTRLDLKYAHAPRDGSFAPVTLASDGAVGNHAAIAVDAQDGAHVAFYEPVGRDLVYGHRPDGAAGFALVTVASEGDVGQFPAIAVDGAGTVHIAYRAGGELLHASKPMGGDFAYASIDSPGMGFLRTAMAVDADGNVHVAYYDDTAGQLRYAFRSACE